MSLSSHIRIIIAAVMTATAFLALECTTPAATPAKQPDAGIAAPLDSVFDSIFTGKANPGATIVIMKDDSIVYSRSFGMARLDKPAPMTDSTLLNVASASKTFTAVGLMKLVADNKVSLDEPLSTFFPDYNREVFSRVTLRHVLSHTSGLPDLRPRTNDQWKEYIKEYPSSFAQAPDYRLYGREEELARFFSTVDSLRFTPGTHFEYNDAPYLLIPQIIERITGESFESWMKTNIFAPAGLTETSYYDPTKHSSRMAHAYAPARGEKKRGVFRSKDGAWDEFDYGEAEFFLTRADNGIFTTPREFMKWVSALYNGRVIPRQYVDSANTRQIDTNVRNVGYGLGLFLEEAPSKPLKPFHSTSNGGFGVFEGGYPDYNIFYLIFANRPDWNRLETATKVDSVLLAKGWIPSTDK